MIPTNRAGAAINIGAQAQQYYSTNSLTPCSSGMWHGELYLRNRENKTLTSFNQGCMPPNFETQQAYIQYISTKPTYSLPIAMTEKHVFMSEVHLVIWKTKQANVK